MPTLFQRALAENEERQRQLEEARRLQSEALLAAAADEADGDGDTGAPASSQQNKDGYLEIRPDQDSKPHTVGVGLHVCLVF